MRALKVFVRWLVGRRRPIVDDFYYRSVGE